MFDECYTNNRDDEPRTPARLEPTGIAAYLLCSAMSNIEDNGWGDQCLSAAG